MGNGRDDEHVLDDDDDHEHVPRRQEQAKTDRGQGRDKGGEDCTVRG